LPNFVSPSSFCFVKPVFLEYLLDVSEEVVNTEYNTTAKNIEKESRLKTPKKHRNLKTPKKLTKKTNTKSLTLNTVT
jgi:hypothetical protein